MTVNESLLMGFLNLILPLTEGFRKREKNSDNYHFLVGSVCA